MTHLIVGAAVPYETLALISSVFFKSEKITTSISWIKLELTKIFFLLDWPCRSYARAPFEERLSVDRRRMEKLLSGRENAR